MSDLDFRSPWERIIDQRAAEIMAEAKRMAESARRCIGQLTRVDHLHRKLERANK